MNTLPTYLNLPEVSLESLLWNLLTCTILSLVIENLRDVFVLEIKIAEKNQSLIRKILEEFPFSPKRFSKYCESMLL